MPMPRELKFRGWDGKKMLEPQDISQAGRYWKWLGKKDVELMQFTGFEDSNGKEIYEGDIVKDQHSKAVAEVVWNPRREGWDYDWKMFPGFETMHEWEVIGNIYENPNLLK